VVAEHEGEGSF